MVEDIEHVRPHLERNAFLHLKILGQRRVQIPVTSASDGAVPQIPRSDGIASRPQRHPGKGRCIQVDSRAGKIGIDGIPADVVGSRVETVLGYVNRLAAARLENTREFPTAENVLSKAVAKNAGRWQIVNPVAIERMRSVAARRSTAGSRIEEILDGIKGVPAEVGSRIAAGIGEPLAPCVIDSQ